MRRTLILRALTLLLCAAALRAHEIGTTRVSVVLLEGRTYQVEVVTDATALAEKVLAATGSSGPAPARAGDLQALFLKSGEVTRARLRLMFDETEVHPDIAYSVEPPIDATSVPAATIRLTGEIPANARQFTWSYGWTFASYAMLVRTAATANPVTQWIEGGDTSVPTVLAAPPAPVSRLLTAWRYLTLGLTHIVPNGLDHMLFVLGIFLLSGRVRSVLLQVSAFTVAHSITLGLSMYGLVSVPPRIVEPMIAVSIAYVAIENIFLSELKSWRVLLVFAFGLLHGLGFAGALKELGLPRSEFFTALLSFNAGVEAGQLTVIGAAYVLVGWYGAKRAWYRSRVVLPASGLIACTAIYWTLQRL